MAAPTSLAANATQAQALAYLEANFHNTYHNAAKTPYEGKNASQLYAYVSGQNPGASPHDVAVAVADLLLSSAVGSGIGQGVSDTSVIGNAATAIETTPLLPSWTTGLTNFLSALTSKNLWIRAAKVLIGGALVLIGLAHMTGASGAVADVARKAPLPV